MKSNWGVLEYAGLYLLGLVLDIPAYRERAKHFLKVCLHIQVLDDGMQWEVSPMYHNEVLLCMMEAIRISQIYGDFLFDDDELALIRRMALVDVYLKNPAHRQPMVGDSDDTDLRDLITQATYLFKDSTLKFGGFDVLDYESIWLYGTQEAKRYSLIPSHPLSAGLTHLESSGQAILRSTKQPVRVDCVPVTNLSYGGTLQNTEGEGYILQVGTRRYGLVLLHQDVGNTTQYLLQCRCG